MCSGYLHENNAASDNTLLPRKAQLPTLTYGECMATAGRVSRINAPPLSLSEGCFRFEKVGLLPAIGLSDGSTPC